LPSNCISLCVDWSASDIWASGPFLSLTLAFPLCLPFALPMDRTFLPGWLLPEPVSRKRVHPCLIPAFPFVFARPFGSLEFPLFRDFPTEPDLAAFVHRFPGSGHHGRSTRPPSPAPRPPGGQKTFSFPTRAPALPSLASPDPCLLTHLFFGPLISAPG